MFKIINDAAGQRYEYAGDGKWAAEGLRFDSEAQALARIAADGWRMAPRVRAGAQVVAA